MFRVDAIVRFIMITTKAVKNPGFKDLPEVLFSPVVDGKELSCCAETEDMAIILGLGQKYDGDNSQFAKMAARMLGIDTKWADRW